MSLKKISKNIILTLYAFIILYLFLLSIIGTSIVGVSKIYYIKEQSIIVILLILLTIAAMFWGKKAFEKCKRKLADKQWLVILLMIYGVISLIFIFGTRFQPFSDAKKIFVVAEQIMSGNYEAFYPGGYMHRYPFQSGYLLLVYNSMKVFGDKTYIFLQLINLASLILLFIFVGKICGYLWQEKFTKCKVPILLGNIFFLPIFFFITLIYGNVPSLGCAVAALYFEYKFFDKKKYLDILLASMLISLSIVLKPNSLIILIAMLGLLIYELIIQKPKLPYTYGVVLLIVLYLLGGKLVQVSMENIIHMPLPKGMPKSAWVMMGLEDMYGIAPGFWNGSSVGLFEKEQYDYEETNKQAIIRIEDKLQQFAADWRSGLKFFGKKVAAQWNEPTYQYSSLITNREAGGGLATKIQQLCDDGSGNYLVFYCNFIQTLIWVGVGCYIVLRWKEIQIEELIFAIIFIGGFLFHLFWEGRSQYVIGYVFLQIPYMVIGYRQLVARIGEMSKKSVVRCLIVSSICLFLFILCGQRVAQMKTFQYTLGVTSSEEELMELGKEQSSS